MYLKQNYRTSCWEKKPKLNIIYFLKTFKQLKGLSLLKHLEISLLRLHLNKLTFNMYIDC